MPHYTPEEIEELIEASLRRRFGDSLSPPQRTVAADIMREVYYSVVDGKTPLTTWQAKVSTLQQQWQNPSSTPQALANFAQLFLQQVAADTMQNIFHHSPEAYDKEGVRLAAQIATGVTDAGLRGLILIIYYNAGNTQFQQKKFAEALEFYQHGLTHAHTWLAELTPDAKDTVLKLYYNAGLTQGQLGNLAAKIESYQHGLTHAHTWLAELTPDAKATVLKLYDAYSGTYYNSHQIAQAIALLADKGLWSWVGFKYSRHKQEILYNWQKDLSIEYRPAQLVAAFQQCFYALLTRDHAPTQSARPFGFITTEVLLQLSETLYALDQAQLNTRLREMYHSLQQLHEHETDWIDATHQLPQLLEKKRTLENQLSALNWWQWWQRFQVSTELNACSREIQHIQQMLSFEHWQRSFERSQTKLLNWLQTGLTQCWQDSAHLQTALAPTHWKTWAMAKNTAPLCIWLDLLPHSPNKQRLTIPQAIAFFEQPALQNWLVEFMNGNFHPLQSQLDLAWKQAQHRAEQLTELFDLLLPEKIAYQHCLAAILLGDETAQLTRLIQNELQKHAPITEKMSILEAVTALKQRFTY